MAQLSLYIEDSMAEKLSIMAKAQNYSVSKYVAALISERITEEEADEEFKKQMLRNLRGSINDTELIEAEEIPWKAEIQRRYDLL